MQAAKLRPEVDHIAPDGSEIRTLLKLPQGQMAHCILPAGKTSLATQHKTVSEIWFILSGEGQIWRRFGDDEQITDLTAGVSIDLPCGTQFQFRNTATEPLVILLQTMPPWPGTDEAIFVEGKWSA